MGKSDFLDFKGMRHFWAKKCKNIKILQKFDVMTRIQKKVKGNFAYKIDMFRISCFLILFFVIALLLETGVLCYFVLVFRRVVIGGIAASTARAIIETPLELAKVSNPQFESFYQCHCTSKISRKKKQFQCVLRKSLT